MATPTEKYRKGSVWGEVCGGRRPVTSLASLLPGLVTAVFVDNTVDYTSCKAKQVCHRTQTSFLVCNSLHHKVTGLVKACCFSHGARPSHLAALSGWLAVPVLHQHPAYGPLCANMTSSINWKYITYLNAARGGPSRGHM